MQLEHYHRFSQNWKSPISYLHGFLVYAGKETKKAAMNEVLMVNIGSLLTGRKVSAAKVYLGKIVLTNPVCTEVGEKISLT